MTDGMFENLLKDENQLNKFINILDQDEKYYLSILSRRKYHSSADVDANQHFRFITKPKYIKNNLQAINPNYFVNKKGNIVHQDALAVYISINPVDQKKAQKILLKNLVDKVLDNSNNQSPLDLAFTALHNSVTKTNFIDLDFDTENTNDIKNQIKEILINPILIQTRGGLHALIKPQEQNKDWYKEISQIEEFDTTNKHIIPLPGSQQSTFIPKIVS